MARLPKFPLLVAFVLAVLGVWLYSTANAAPASVSMVAGETMAINGCPTSLSLTGNVVTCAAATSTTQTPTNTPLPPSPSPTAAFTSTPSICPTVQLAEGSGYQDSGDINLSGGQCRYFVCQATTFNIDKFSWAWEPHCFSASETDHVSVTCSGGVSGLAESGSGLTRTVQCGTIVLPSPTTTVTASATPTSPPGPTATPPSGTYTDRGCINSTTTNQVIEWVRIRNCGDIGINVTSNNVTIRNVWLEGNEKNIRFIGVTGGLVENAILIDPQNTDGDYDQQIGLNTSNNITIRNVTTTCGSNCEQEDAIGVWYSDNNRIENVSITGGGSGSGCGIMNDSGSDNNVYIGNTIADQVNCGVGVANGHDVLVQGNTVNAPIGNVAFYAENYGDLACGPNIRFIDNTTNDDNPFWTGGGCGAVYEEGNSWN